MNLFIYLLEIHFFLQTLFPQPLKLTYPKLWKGTVVYGGHKTFDL